MVVALRLRFSWLEHDSGPEFGETIRPDLPCTGKGIDQEPPVTLRQRSHDHEVLRAHPGDHRTGGIKLPGAAPLNAQIKPVRSRGANQIEGTGASSIRASLEAQALKRRRHASPQEHEAGQCRRAAVGQILLQYRALASDPNRAPRPRLETAPDTKGSHRIPRLRSQPRQNPGGARKHTHRNSAAPHAAPSPPQVTSTRRGTAPPQRRALAAATAVRSLDRASGHASSGVSGIGRDRGPAPPKTGKKKSRVSSSRRGRGDRMSRPARPRNHIPASLPAPSPQALRRPRPEHLPPAPASNARRADPTPSCGRPGLHRRSELGLRQAAAAAAARRGLRPLRSAGPAHHPSRAAPP